MLKKSQLIIIFNYYYNGRIFISHLTLAQLLLAFFKKKFKLGGPAGTLHMSWYRSIGADTT